VSNLSGWHDFPLVKSTPVLEHLKAHGSSHLAACTLLVGLLIRRKPQVVAFALCQFWAAVQW
jgi:hypothetical protein